MGYSDAQLTLFIIRVFEAEETLQSAYAEMKMQQIKICCIKYDLATSCAKVRNGKVDIRTMQMRVRVIHAVYATRTDLGSMV